MPYTSTPDERLQVDAIRTGLNTAKQQLNDVCATINTAQTKLNTLMQAQRTASRTDTEAQCLEALGNMEEVEGLARQARGKLRAAHATMSRGLCAAFTDGSNIVLAGPVR